MQRPEFIAAVGTAAALASASKAFAQAAGGGEMEESMHPPKYEALEKAAAHCVATGNAGHRQRCPFATRLRHRRTMWSWRAWQGPAK